MTVRATEPPLMHRWPPRCPHPVEITSVEQLMPFLEAVAKRPYSQGLHAAWDLQPGERVLVFVDNWYDPLCVDAVVKVLEKHQCQVTVQRTDRGPIKRFEGHDEVEIFINLTKELADWMGEWQRIEQEGKYDKLLWGFGGPVLSDARVKIQRMPFINPEMLASPAHTMPYEVLAAIDEWTWEHICRAKHVRITDPEGTDVTYSNHDAYYDASRRRYADEWLSRWVPSNKGMWQTYLPGHVWGKPWFLNPLDDGSGVVAGTMNHIGPYPRIEMKVENSRITEIRDGGLFGEKLRKLEKETGGLEYPGHPGKGLLYWWEASIGTNPKIHRPRKNYLQGWACGLYERMRSGVIHIGFGTVVTTDLEVAAARAGLPVGHFHVHLYFPTVTLDLGGGKEELLIDAGHLLALDDPKVREIAARYGDPTSILSEDWVPAVPGINMEGDYLRDYAADPLDWTLTELHICEKWHGLYMKMVAPPGADAHSHHHHHGKE